MSLTDAQIRALSPGAKSIKKADAKGLYIEIMPTGSKLWRLKYRHSGKEKRLALGAYPEITLSEARKRRDAARAKIEQGLDPALLRKRERVAARISSENTFHAIAEEYLKKMVLNGRAEATLRKARWFLALLKPSIGQLPITEVDPQLLLEALLRQERRGNHETAKKCRSFASRVFRYAVATGRAKADPAALLQGALVTPSVKHYAAIHDPIKFGALLRAIDAFDGHPVTKLGLQIAPHVFVRPGELRKANWQEFNFGEKIWKIPPERMKGRRPHNVPLSEQVHSLLQELQGFTGNEGFAFPALHTTKRPMSENTLNMAFRRMGFGKDEVTAHGLRSTASTLLNESGLWNPDAIERALAHADRDPVRGAYHRGQHWDERVRMAQWWSDYLDDLKLR